MSVSVRDFYKDKTIFITGSSGYLTKFIIEKLLDSCDVRKIYLLLSDPTSLADGNCNFDTKMNEEASKKYRRKALFNFRLNEQHRSKIIGVIGSITLDNFGLYGEQLKQVEDETQIMFHCEETTSFTDPLDVSVSINVLGTLNATKFASKMNQLKSFVFISSAFTASYTGRMEEVIYSPKIDTMQLIEQVRCSSGDKINHQLFNKFKGEHVTTYTLTKSLADDIVVKFARSTGVSSVIVKPAIISAPAVEPVAGFIDTFYQGTSDIVATIGLGIQRIFNFDPQNNIPIIPVDYCANATIISASNCVNSNVNPLIIGAFNTTSNFVTTGTYFDSILRESKLAPSIRAVRSFGRNTFTINKLSYLIQLFLYNQLFAYIYDGCMSLIGEESRFSRLLKRSTHSMDTLYALLSIRWIIDGHNLKDEWDKLSNEEKSIFNVDCSHTNWPNYLSMMWHGFRTYTLKETNRDLCDAQQKKDHFMHVFLLFKSAAVAFILTLFFILYQPIKSVAYATGRTL